MRSRRPTSATLTWRKWPRGEALPEFLRPGMMVLYPNGWVGLVGDINSVGGTCSCCSSIYCKEAAPVAYSVTLCTLFTSVGRRKDRAKLAKKFGEQDD